ncbi:hypothetical protein OV427_17915 [Pyxidicoccus sp. MSG2]|nr:hypothetical protein [Pyxidicoccus sp. MSG2]MCY1017647.1 hypothetical protein [Pyxidicoccus sp. MSG2]
MVSRRLAYRERAREPRAPAQVVWSHAGVSAPEEERRARVRAARYVGLLCGGEPLDEGEEPPGAVPVDGGHLLQHAGQLLLWLQASQLLQVQTQVLPRHAEHPAEGRQQAERIRRRTRLCLGRLGVQQGQQRH